jgi:hypothetical protein
VKHQRAAFAVFLTFLALSLFWYFYPSHERPYLPAPPAPVALLTLDFLQQPSSIGSKEDPDARKHYEVQMLRDPATGLIPANIRKQELNFVRNIPDSRSRRKQFRQAGLQETEWESAGPFNIGGRTRALKLDIDNENIILAGGVSGGMWRSENKGQSWQKTTDQDIIQSVTALAQDTRPGKTHIWYYGTGELIGNSARGGNAPYRGDGILKSTDGGRNWQFLEATSTGNPQFFDSPFNFVFNIKVNSANLLLDEVYAACAGGIFRSPDGGSSWQASLADSAALYSDVEISSRGVLYAAMSADKFRERFEITGVFRSTDGISWQNITPPGWPQDFGRTVIGMNPVNEDEVYFLVQSEEGDRLWRYHHNAGPNPWTDLSENLPDFGGEVGALNLQGSYNMLLKVHPTQPNTVFLGGTNLYRSSDGFRTSDNISWIGGYDTTNNVSKYPGHHPDQHALIFYPSNPNRSISGHDGGLSLTTDILAEDVSWNYLNNGYRTSQFYTIGLDQTQVNDIIIGGLQDNGSQITNTAHPASSWRRILGGDGGYTHVAYKGAYYYVSFQNGQIYRTTLDDDFSITSFARIDPPGAGEIEDQSYIFINPFTFDPNNNNRMYLAAGNVVYRNRNLSQIPAGSQEPSLLNWDILPNTAINRGSISAISASTEPANIVYYGTNQGELFKIDNANGIAPEAVRISHRLFPAGGYVANIAINPLDGNEVIVVFSNYNVRSIFHSTDGGLNFTDVGGNLEENPDGSGRGPSVRHVEIIPLRNGAKLFLAGTSTGLYSSLSLEGGGTVWTQEAPETIGNAVVPQMRYRSLDGRVVIATHGNGVYFKNWDNVEVIDTEPAGQALSLGDPYPNPFIEEVIIPFSLPEGDHVRIRVYNEMGQLLKELLWASQFAGESEISWDGTDASGMPLPGGLYFIRMEYKDQVLHKRLVLAR